jgi:hypothetical protein
MSSAIGCISDSMNTPVGSPFASFSIVNASTGDTVARVIPARFKASVLAQDTSGGVLRQKPQIERIKTGLFGAAASSSWRVGHRFSARISGTSK